MGKVYAVEVESRPYLRVANVQAGFLDLRHIKYIEVPRSEALKSELRPNDVVLTEGGDIDKLGRGAIWSGQIKGCIHQNHIFAVRPDPASLSPKFLTYILESPHGRSYFQVTAKQTTNLAATNRSTLGRLPLFLPPRPEQDQIVAYLRAQDAHIARFIKAKRELIKLLTEQKLRIIDQAVTRGLNPNVRLKDSGVEWLGEVPEHWEVKPLKRWVRVNARTLSQKTSPDFEFRYVDIGSVQTGRLVKEPERIRFEVAPSRARRVLRRGDTIISTVRTYLKAIWYVSEDADDLIASTGFAVLTPGTGVEPEYLGYVIQSSPFVNRVTANSIGIAYPAIAETVLGRFPVALPPTVDEQQVIVTRIKTESAPLDEAISRTEEEIKLIREYRDRLIADVVTGQIDVRGWRPGPDDVASDEELAVLGDDETELREDELGDGGE
ncbi:MAG: restriction endonuclease subunit S [Bryobacteraceae bacterium]|nr:restriction endonuclease subunit S [Bryobacteraceae bacterium]